MVEAASTFPRNLIYYIVIIFISFALLQKENVIGVPVQFNSMSI